MFAESISVRKKNKPVFQMRPNVWRDFPKQDYGKHIHNKALVNVTQHHTDKPLMIAGKDASKLDSFLPIIYIGLLHNAMIKPVIFGIPT